MKNASGLVSGHYAPGFEPLAEQFARHFESGEEYGASLCVYRRGEKVVDLWGGLADTESRKPWTADTLLVVFSCTKGLAAMALNMAAERGLFEWDRPVARYWPEFAQNGKASITVRQLFNHRAGLAALTTPLTLDEICDPSRKEQNRSILAAQKPAWVAESRQGYHAISFGLYADAFFELVVGESIASFLKRELLGPLGADVFLGTPEEEDARIATLYPVPDALRVKNMVREALRGGSTEANVARSFLRGGVAKTALLNPRAKNGMHDYNRVPARRLGLSWASATASARGLARAYLPWSMGGVVEGRRYVKETTIAQVMARQGWSESDLVLGKALGWSQGFLKEEAGVYSPNPESFGHAGMGGTLGWCDPKHQLSFGYVMNRCDWRIRSPRALALCRALYESRLD